MKKLVGYVIVAIGFFSMVAGTNFVYPNLDFVQSIPSFYLLLGGLVLVLIGVFFLKGNKKSSFGLKEIPIYHGKEIVGYRRN